MRRDEGGGVSVGNGEGGFGVCGPEPCYRVLLIRTHGYLATTTCGHDLTMEVVALIVFLIFSLFFLACFFYLSSSFLTSPSHQTPNPRR